MLHLLHILIKNDAIVKKEVNKLSTIKTFFSAQRNKKIVTFLALATLAILLGQLVAVLFLKARFTI